MKIGENIDTKNYTNLEKLFLIILFSYFFINLFSYNNFFNNYDDANIEYKKCSYFIQSSQKNIDELEIKIEKRDVYVFPEITNILCIGRVISYEILDNKLNIYIGTNTKFINFLIFASQLSILLLYLFILRKNNYKFINGLLILFFLFTYFLSLNVISYLLFLIFPTIFYFTNNNKSGEGKVDKNSIHIDILLIFFLLFIFLLIQPSSHNYETIDWDINSFIVASLDIGRGNLPLENQFENKQPLLFIIYYLFTLISGGKLIFIKLLNDLVLFSCSLLIYLIIRENNKKRGFEPFLGSLIFILLTSNFWFHPGYSEIFSILFISTSYFVLKKAKRSDLKILLSGILFSFSTTINIGTIIFVISFLLFIFNEFDNPVKKIFTFLMGFGIVHLLLITLYSFFGLINLYLISFIYLPLSYSNSEFIFFDELTVFLNSLYDYNILILIILFICFSNIVSKFTSRILIEKKLYKISHLNEFIFCINGLAFYYFAAKGYYHHLFFFLFFLSFGISSIPTKNYKFIFSTLIFIATFQTIILFGQQSMSNLSNLNNLEENYPVKNISKLVENQIDLDDTIFSSENILILYYLDKPNSSYIVHPGLYNYEEVLDVLYKNNKVTQDEIKYQISLSPKLIEGSKEYIDMEVYMNIDTSKFETELTSYWARNERIDIYIRNK